MFILKGDMVEISDLYFLHAKEQITFIYPGLNLCYMYLFKVVQGCQVVDDEYAPPIGEITMNRS